MSHDLLKIGEVYILRCSARYERSMEEPSKSRLVETRLMCVRVRECVCVCVREREREDNIIIGRVKKHDNRVRVRCTWASTWEISVTLANYDYDLSSWNLINWAIGHILLTSLHPESHFWRTLLTNKFMQTGLTCALPVSGNTFTLA